MEGILLELEVLSSPWSIVAGSALLAIAAAAALLGYTAEEERAGRRLFWAEWPIPESEAPPREEELRLAA